MRKAKQYWTDPDKIKKDAQQKMYEHYHREPEKCRTSAQVFWLLPVLQKSQRC